MEELVEAIKKRLRESAGLTSIVDPDRIILSEDDDSRANGYPSIVLLTLDFLGVKKDTELRPNNCVLYVYSNHSERQLRAIVYFIKCCLNEVTLGWGNVSCTLHDLLWCGAESFRKYIGSGLWSTCLEYLAVYSTVTKEAADPTVDSTTLNTDELPPDPAEEGTECAGVDTVFSRYIAADRVFAELYDQKLLVEQIVENELDIPQLARLVSIVSPSGPPELRDQLEAQLLLSDGHRVIAALEDIGYSLSERKDKIEAANIWIRAFIAEGRDVEVGAIARMRELPEVIVELACKELVRDGELEKYATVTWHS